MSDDATTRAEKSLRSALILAGAQVAGALILTLANKMFGWIDDETATRGVMALIGFGLMTIGNALPKQQEGPPSQTVRDIAIRQSITRVGGWMMMLGGLIWVGLWVFATRELAVLGGIAAVGATSLVMIIYAVWSVGTHRRTSAS